MIVAGAANHFERRDEMEKFCEKCGSDQLSTAGIIHKPGCPTLTYTIHSGSTAQDLDSPFCPTCGQPDTAALRAENERLQKRVQELEAKMDEINKISGDLIIDVESWINEKLAMRSVVDAAREAV